MLAGAAPFLACALLPIAGVEAFGRLGRLDQLASDYGVAILCFLTGIHWATQLYARAAAPFNLFIGSNVVFLAVFVVATFSSYVLICSRLFGIDHQLTIFLFKL